MKKTILNILTVLILLSLSSCSLIGGGSGEGSELDPMGEGNIPLAVPGSELHDINFDYNSSILSTNSRTKLRENSQYLLDNPSISVTLEGHCDERGTAEFNLVLGQTRAQIVKDYLVTAGVDSSRLETQSYGEELPLVAGNDEQAWAENRRVHFKIEN